MMSDICAMLAVDLDGTLLDPKGRISAGNRAAIHKAADAGLLVVPCTGRSWIESQKVLEQWPRVDGPHLGVFVSGASVTDLDSGVTVDVAVIESHLVDRLIGALEDLPEAVLVFRDANHTGHDYLVTGRGELTPNTRWWFESQGARVHEQRAWSQELCHHVLRVGVVAKLDRMREVTAKLRAMFSETEIVLHYFAAVQNPDPRETIYILEIFAAGVDKWRGIRWLAGERGIDESRIAAIGDEINDVAMIERASCGIAMGNAIAAVRDVANEVTLDNTSDGVAYAIEQLLSGRWGAGSG